MASSALGLPGTMASEDPKYIQYLLNPKKKFDFYFMVGNGKNNSPIERIGVVRDMLQAHSEVFRVELDESPLKETGVKPPGITDVFPNTFKNLLRYVYGHDITGSLCFDNADDLLYVADKYMVESLKASLATRLMSLLTPDNICSLLNNPAVYRVLELQSTITKILQYETSKVLVSKQFPSLCPSGFLKILEQSQLDVPEIALWRAAVKWASSRGGCEVGSKLRQQLTPHLKHIRVCTLSSEELSREVVNSGILTEQEVAKVCLAVVTKTKQQDLTEICNKVVPRKLTLKSVKPQVIKSRLLQVELSTVGTWYKQAQETIVMITTLGSSIELIRLGMSYNKYTFNCDCSITVERIVNSQTEQTCFYRHVQQNVATTPCGSFEITVYTSLEENVILNANSLYKITTRFSEPKDMRTCEVSVSQNFHTDHFSVHFCDSNYPGYVTHINNIEYRTITSA